jgi:hypothetical protein
LQKACNPSYHCRQLSILGVWSKTALAVLSAIAEAIALPFFLTVGSVGLDAAELA